MNSEMIQLKLEVRRQAFLKARAVEMLYASRKGGGITVKEHPRRLLAFSLGLEKAMDIAVNIEEVDKFASSLIVSYRTARQTRKYIRTLSQRARALKKIIKSYQKRGMSM